MRLFSQFRPSPRKQGRTGRQWNKEKPVRPLLAREDIAPFCLTFPTAEVGKEMRGEEVDASAVSHRKKSMNQDEKGKGNYFKFLRARAPEGLIFQKYRMQSL